MLSATISVVYGGRSGEPLAHATEPGGELVAQRLDLARSEAADPIEPAVPRGGLELLERVDVQLLVQAAREGRPDARHAPQELLRRGFPA